MCAPDDTPIFARPAGRAPVRPPPRGMRAVPGGAAAATPAARCTRP